MARMKTVEFELLRRNVEDSTGFTTEVDSLWNVYLSALGRDDGDTIKEEHGITNAWFPFSKHTLRRLLNSRLDEANFEKWQQDLLIDTHWPEAYLKEFVHVALEDGDDFMEVNHQFGHGAFGHVEQVTIPTVSKPLVCVRKKIQRPRPLHAQCKCFEALSNEISVMRQIAHHHCVQLVGSYTDHDSMGILLLPIADMDLATFLNLEELSDADEKFLRQSIGCLCSALSYIHSNKIRHEDLKPQNILVKGNNILLADFGFSLDFSDDSISTTTGIPAGCTPRYAAPEVLEQAPRSRATDIYSLGCIMIEMISCLYGYTLSDLKSHWKQSGNKIDGFHQNQEAQSSWCSALTSLLHFHEKDRIMLKYAEYMLVPNRKSRPSAKLVVQKVKDLETRFPANLPIIRQCCGNENDIYKESAFSTNLSSMRLRRLWLNMASYWQAPLLDDHNYVVLDSHLQLIVSKEYLAPTDRQRKLSHYFKSPNKVNSACEALLHATTRPSATGPTNDFWRIFCRGKGRLGYEDNSKHMISDCLSASNPWRVHMVSTEMHGGTRIPLSKSSLKAWSHPSNTIKVFAVPTCYLSQSDCRIYFFLISWQYPLPLKSIF